MVKVAERSAQAAKIAAKMVDFVRKVQKRDGSIVPFDLTHITSAIHRAMLATGEGSEREAELVANKVYADLVRIARRYTTFIPTVEGIQDSVEKELILNDYIRTAKAYILYRQERARIRAASGAVPERVRELVSESKKYFRNPLAEFVYYRTYARWIDEEGRRETWVETVDRYMAFMKESLGTKLKQVEYDEVREAIVKQEAMPSMRLLQFAGKAARATNVAAYNCSFIAPSKIQDFAEIMYVSMCGTGVGFSVESKNIQKLPQIKPQNGKKHPTYIIHDSKEGWADALAFGMRAWFSGEDVAFDYSHLRPAGARLKTMGGKSSGPQPLRELLDFSRQKILRKQGRRLSNLDAHDVICKIGTCVVAGGVRRSAMISLSDLDDEEMRDAKKGQFYLTEPQRSVANNSAVYDRKPTTEEFLDEWIALLKSNSGERGIFNRGGLAKTLPERRLKLLKGVPENMGTNPCGEILLQNRAFCNLSEVVCRPSDTEETLLRKVRIASLLGTYQATLTNLPYLSKEWQRHCEQERLLGVSLTGQWDSPVVRNAETLRKLRKEAVRVNQQYAKRFGTSASSCVTCVKPSGTLSQTVDASSGMHPRFSPYYIRRVRISATDSLFKMLRDQGVPYYPEVGQGKDDATTYVIEFPVKAPSGAVFKDDLSALEQLEHWKLVKVNYTEHNPSCTIYIGEDEWVAVANWLYENWDIIGGLSFLPRQNHVYQLAPYEEISKEMFDELARRWENVDFAKIVTYEKQDETEQARELACAGGVCEI